MPRLGTSTLPGACFGAAPIAARALASGLGVAVARRGIFRPSDQQDFGRVAERVAAGNMALLGDAATDDAAQEKAYLRNAIACGALLTAGRHLVRGDETEPSQPMEYFVNCATAAASFTSFYLLLCGAGVGRCYDDALCLVDWQAAPRLFFHLATDHADFAEAEADLRQALTPEPPAMAACFRIPDHREGWARALEIIEAGAHARQRDTALWLDFSAIRPKGQPIRGLGGQPAPGPLPLLRALIALRDQVVLLGKAMPPWEQALRVDHLMAMAVRYGGVRRAARMAAKTWRDVDTPRFATGIILPGPVTATHAILVDAEFWARLAPAEATAPEELSRHAQQVFMAATDAIHANGAPGFINTDQLTPSRPIDVDVRIGSAHYPMQEGAGMLRDIAIHAAGAPSRTITNPCGEVALPVTGGFCVVADFAPLLACPLPLAAITPGALPADIAQAWDERVLAALRLGVRFLIRVNRMAGIYAAETLAHNPIGIGPTGLHEWAWLRFGFGFDDLVHRTKSQPFWRFLAQAAETAKQEANRYAKSLGMAPPIAVTTIKPAGTTSLLFGLTAGAHLPPARHYLRWVQYHGQADDNAEVAALRDAGYPQRWLGAATQITLVGFPCTPLLVEFGIGDQLRTADQVSLAAQYHWLELLQQHWIGASQGHQISCTLRFDAHAVTPNALRSLIRRHQPELRAAALLPLRHDSTSPGAYMPEEPISSAAYEVLMARITAA